MARDRYLWNAGEETIHRDGEAVTLQTPKGKWENFWYYHKFHLLIALVVIALIVSFVYELTTKEEPDYQIGVLTQTKFSDEAATVLEQKIARYGKDLNGDGRVIVRVNSYLIVMEEGKEVSDPSFQMASVAKFLSDLEAGDSMIFLTDDASFRAHQKTRQMFSNLDGTVPKAGKEKEAAMRLPWKDAKPLSSLITEADLGMLDADSRQKVMQQLDGLGASLRVFSGTPLEQNPEKVSYYTASCTLFDRLVSGK
ncbi:hypothetical protein [Faecalispora anaeroviscerum]|uniref:hypothetical protein n=1 Tax=Faecalispora anaeroviscerum TaxID=2991836 RepID=UPI0024B8787F|nr:hypothetical protein [Faecalispora anaeroviscerum]